MLLIQSSWTIHGGFLGGIPSHSTYRIAGCRTLNKRLKNLKNSFGDLEMDVRSRRPAARSAGLVLNSLLELTIEWRLQLRRHCRAQLFTQHAAIDLGTRAFTKESVLRLDALFHGFQHCFQKHALHLRRNRLRVGFLA